MSRPRLALLVLLALLGMSAPAGLARSADAPPPRRGDKPTPPAGMDEPAAPAPPANPTPAPAPAPAPAPTPPADPNAKPPEKATDWTPFMGKLKFIVGYEDGLDAAWAAGRPAMLFFVKAKSHWSMTFGQRTFSNADVTDKLVFYQPVLVDLADDPELAKRYGVTDVPAVVFVDREAKLLVISQGDVAVEEFQETADEARMKGPAPAPPEGELALLARIREDLKKATEAGNVKKMLDAAAALSSLRRPHSAALEGQKLADELDKKGQARLATAMMARADGRSADARSEFERIAADFRGRPIGKVAAEQLREIAGEGGAK